MKLFVSKPAKKFSLQSAGKELKMHQALSYRASKLLIGNRWIIRDENRLYHLNYKENQQELIAVEYFRTSDFLSNPRHSRFRQFTEEFISKAREDKFIFMLFGSAVIKDKPRDYDILVLFDDIKKAQTYENILINLSENYPEIKIHVNVDSISDLEEMLINRDEKNIANEALNQHIIFFGAELFFRILKRVRPYA